jgi:ribonucleoside-diphosphate reductase beta chain
MLNPAIEWMKTQTSEYKHVKAIFLALIASYGLEAIRFMVSFCTSLGMLENKIFVGNGNIIKLILADERLHTTATAWQINTVIKTDPRFAQVAFELKDTVREMLLSVIAEEKAWAKHQFSKGTVLGLTEQIMCNQVDWAAQESFKEIGVKYDAGVKSAPLPWMNRYLNTNKTQTALQENESVDYVLAAMTSEVHYDQLPQI